MIISRLYGGMGNQMFQYAYGRMLSKKHNTTFKIYFDDCGFGWAEHSKHLALNDFNIQAQIATDNDRAEFICDSKNKVVRVFHKLKRMIKGLHYIGDGNKMHIYHHHVLNAPNNSYTDGFWQSEIYFKESSDIIRSDFSVKTPLSEYAKNIEQKIKNSNSISIHVRRGDYLEQANNYVICDEHYFYRAFNAIKSEIENPSIFIFSNDTKWAHENLKFDAPTFIVEGTKAYEDMHLMSCCKHNISSNSTFGWWGAWLNPNKNKKVVIPANWLHNKNFNTDHYLAEGWMKI